MVDVVVVVVVVEVAMGRTCLLLGCACEGAGFSVSSSISLTRAAIRVTSCWTPIAVAGRRLMRRNAHNGAQIGVLISLREPTKSMRVEVCSAGFYTTGWNQSYPRLQVLTIAELLNGKRVEYPGWSTNATYRSAPRVQTHGDQAMQQPLWRKDSRDDGPVAPAL